MFSLKMMQFDSSGWRVLKNNSDSMLWVVEPELLVEQVLFPVTDYKHDLRDPELFRADMAELMMEVGGAVIDFAVSDISGMTGFTIVGKTWVNKDDEDLRKAYTGTISFPLAEGCFQIKAMGVEQNPTGVRESVVAMSLIAEGKVSLPKGNVSMEAADKPLARTIKEQAMVRAPGDDIEYDKDFPSHPLTRVRATLQKIKESLTVDPAVRNARPYRVPDAPSDR